MSARERLWQQILDHPERDQPRLVYADWLVEQGHAERGEIIRLQLQAPSSAEPSEREKQLLDQFGLHWLQEELPPELHTQAKMHRGFFSEIRCTADVLFVLWQQDMPLYPIDQATVLINSISMDWLAVGSKKLRWPLRDLSIHTTFDVGSIVLHVLKQMGPFPLLERLTIADSGLDYGLGNELADALNYFPSLKMLDFSHCSISDNELNVLLHPPWSEHDFQLRLEGNNLSDQTLQNLAHRLCDPTE